MEPAAAIRSEVGLVRTFVVLRSVRSAEELRQAERVAHLFGKRTSGLFRLSGSRLFGAFARVAPVLAAGWSVLCLLGSLLMLALGTGVSVLTGIAGLLAIPLARLARRIVRAAVRLSAKLARSLWRRAQSNEPEREPDPLPARSTSGVR